MPDQPGEPIIRVRGLVNRFGCGDGPRRSRPRRVPRRSSRRRRRVRVGEIGPVADDHRAQPSGGRGYRGLSEATFLTMSDNEQREIEKHWGVLFQDGALFSSLTVAQNIEVPLKEYYDMPLRLMDEIAAFKIGIVGLPEGTGEKYPVPAVGRNAQARWPRTRPCSRSGDRLSRRADRRARSDRGRRVRHIDSGPEEQPGPHRIHGDA